MAWWHTVDVTQLRRWTELLPAAHGKVPTAPKITLVADLTAAQHSPTKWRADADDANTSVEFQNGPIPEESSLTKILVSASL